MAPHGKDGRERNL